MEARDNTRQQYTGKRLRRLSLAITLALILLVLPVAVETIIRIPLSPLLQPEALTKSSITQLKPHWNDTVSLSFSLGAALVHATNGLTITKSAPSMVDQGGVLAYTLMITNQTGSVITSGVVIDPLPDDVACDENSVDPSSDWQTFGCNNDSPPRFVSFAIPSDSPFANGATVQLIYTVDVSQPLPDGHEIVNSGYIFDPTNPNLDSVSGSPVTTIVKAPQWLISKTVSTDIIQPGEILIYTITATNVGALATSGNYSIEDTVPDNTSLVEAPGAISLTPPTWTFNDSLAAFNGTRTVTYSVQVDSPLSTGTLLVNDGYMVSGGNVFSPATNDPVTVTVQSPVDLSISKIASTDPIQVGELVTYTLTITNIGTLGPAEDIVVTDTLPAEVTYLSAGFLGGATGTVDDAGGNPIIWTLDNPIAPDSSVQVRVTARVNAIALPDPAVITNSYEASASNAALVAGSMAVGIAPGLPDSTIVSLGSTMLQPCQTTEVTTTLLDEGGNPVPGQPVSLALVPVAGNADASLAPSSGVTDASGVMTATLTAELSGTIRVIGWWTPEFSTQDFVDAEIDGLTVPDQLSLNVLPNPILSGGNNATVTATLSDCHGGFTQGETIDFQLSDVNLATFPGPSDSATDVTGANGEATATLTSGSNAGTLTITGTFAALQAVTTLDIISPVPALSITKTANPPHGTNVTTGSTISYTIQVSNPGNGNATNVIVTDILPAAVNVVSVISSTTGAGSISGPTFPGGNQLVLTASQLEPGQTLAATIVVTVTETAPGSTLNNVANARSDTVLPVASNTVTHNVTGLDSAGDRTYLPIIRKE